MDGCTAEVSGAGFISSGPGMEMVKAEYLGNQILSNQLFATFCAAASQNFTAILGGHTGAETMSTFAFQVAGLECSFHDITT